MLTWQEEVKAQVGDAEEAGETGWRADQRAWGGQGEELEQEEQVEQE